MYRSSRRNFLGAAASSAALASLPTADAIAGKTNPRYVERNRVDMHSHHLVPAYKEALLANGIVAFHRIPVPEWSPELALQFMDAHDIAFQMLSTTDPGVSFVADDAEANDLARRVNDEAQAVVLAHRKRFGALAVVNLRSVEAATAESIRCLDQLKMDGVGLLSSAEGRYIGDPIFAPLLQALNDRKAWVFVHPTAPGGEDKPDYSMPDFLAEYPFDTTRAIISLMFNGAFSQFPNIRWQFAHLGGTIPMIRERLTTLAANAKQFGALLGFPPGSATLDAEHPNRFLRRHFYDTALTADPPELEAAKAMAGTRRILYGSDWPFSARTFTDEQVDPAPDLGRTFSVGERHRIDRLNARSEFKSVAAAVPAKP
jgi:6-methylsalicylate decarboxylase